MEETGNGDTIVESPTEIVAVQEQHANLDWMADISQEEFDASIARVKISAERRQTALSAIFLHLRPTDFVDFDGKPYLQGMGAERIALALGISLSSPVFCSERVGEDLFYECLIEASWRGMSACAIGTCSTRDKLWGGKIHERLAKKYNGDTNLARREIAQNVMKKAHANAKSRVICSITATHGITWKQLEAIGWKRDKGMAKITFKKAVPATLKEAHEACDRLGSGPVQQIQAVPYNARRRLSCIADLMSLPKGQAGDLSSVDFGSAELSESGKTFMYQVGDHSGNIVVYVKRYPDQKLPDTKPGSKVRLEGVMWHSVGNDGVFMAELASSPKDVPPADLAGPEPAKGA